MKLLSVGIVALSLYTVSISAGCECQPGQADCIETCVKEANACVGKCKGNVPCYQDCIDNRWPSSDMFKPVNSELKNNNATGLPENTNTSNATTLPSDMNTNSTTTITDPLNGMNGTMVNSSSSNATLSSGNAISTSPFNTPSTNNTINQHGQTMNNNNSMVHPNPLSSGVGNSISQATNSPTHKSSSTLLQVSTTVLLVSSLCGVVMNII
ncbi:hypothetical protein BJ944DRAFT_273406 [Cunninghamella echinulata]|nr:hypothetical protein BJ944DRAFT_273406 [Cunninghamella echinulata]